MLLDKTPICPEYAGLYGVVQVLWSYQNRATDFTWQLVPVVSNLSWVDFNACKTQCCVLKDRGFNTVDCTYRWYKYIDVLDFLICVLRLKRSI